MSKRTFFAAKVNIHGNILSPNLDELINVFIPRVILKSEPMKIGTWNWTFTDVEEVFVDNQRLITGNVTKSKFSTQKIRIGQKTEQRESEFELAHTAFFVYNPQGEILAHESTGSISAKEFRDLFTRLLSRDPHVGEVKIMPIPSPHKIRTEIMSIEKVTMLHFYLIHPNPGKEEFNQYQQIIDDAGLLELEIKMVNNNGIAIEDKIENGQIQLKQSIENGIFLVEAGYGDIDIKGHDEIIIPPAGRRKRKKVNKKKRSFSSRNAVRFIKISENDRGALLKGVVSFILDVKNKVFKDDDHDDGYGA